MFDVLAAAVAHEAAWQALVTEVIEAKAAVRSALAALIAAEQKPAEWRQQQMKNGVDPAVAMFVLDIPADLQAEIDEARAALDAAKARVAAAGDAMKAGVR